MKFSLKMIKIYQYLSKKMRQIKNYNKKNKNELNKMKWLIIK